MSLKPLFWGGLLLGGIVSLAAWQSYQDSEDGEDGEDGEDQKKDLLSLERRRFLEEVRAHLGTWYQWGGGRNPNSDYGVDCSGLIIASLRNAGYPQIPCPLATSNGWWQCLTRIDVPIPGDLAFYGNKSQDRAIHVEVVETWNGEHATLIGANGGDKDVTSEDIARKRNAFVKKVATNKRPNFLGFVRLPLEDMVRSHSKISEHDLISFEAPISFELQEDEA